MLIPLLIDAQLQVVSNMRGGKGTTIVTNSIRGHVELVGGMKLKDMVQQKILDEDTVEVRIEPDGKRQRRNTLDQRLQVLIFLEENICD